jgi:hypothetical protein
MKRFLLPVVCAAAAGGCVSIQGLPDPHGALAPGQRLVVAVYPSPGPWIIGSADTKAEAAAKISPLGFIVSTAENEHTLSVSKNLQQYLPRPNLGLAVQESLLTALRAVRSTGTVQTAPEAGIATPQLAEWNKSKNQLDWRQRYYAPDPDEPAPRDYARALTLDDALILDVNVSFGTDATDDGRLLPTMSAASRVYRGDTTHLLWQNEDIVSDQTSSATMTDYQLQPWQLTEGLKKLAPALGTAVAGSFLKAFALLPSTSTVHHASVASAGGGGGLVPISAFQDASTSTPAGVASSTSGLAAAASSTTAVSGVSISTVTPPVASSAAASSPAAAPPPVSASVPAISSAAAAGIPVSSGAAASPAAAPPAALAATTPPSLPGMGGTAPTVSLSTPSVSVSTPP